MSGGRVGDIGHGHGPGSADVEERLEAVAAGDDQPEALLRTLEDVAAERRLKFRDCRDCKNFQRDASGLNFGWCGAHEQYVKLYHPAGEWFSQCLFKGIRRFKPQEFERARVLAAARRAATGAQLEGELPIEGELPLYSPVEVEA